MGGAPLLSFKEVSKRFIRSGLFSSRSQEVLALSQVSFDIHRGEVLGLVGESGSGKTTLGKIAVGLIPPSSGQVLFEGKELSPKLELGRKMGMVFQNPLTSLNPRMRVGEIVEEPLKIQLKLSSSERRLRLKELFEKVGLPLSLANCYPDALSTGQRQRVGIARAIATSPRFVVLDEPVSALDLTVQAQILALLSQLCSEFGLTYLLISHDLRVVAGMSDRVVVMYRGRVVELGRRKEIMEEARHPYTRVLLNSIPTPKGRRRARFALAKEEAPPLTNGRGCPFAPRCPEVEERCGRETPSLRPVSSSHFVSCHLIE